MYDLAALRRSNHIFAVAYLVAFFLHSKAQVADADAPTTTTEVITVATDKEQRMKEKNEDRKQAPGFVQGEKQAKNESKDKKEDKESSR